MSSLRVLYLPVRGGRGAFFPAVPSAAASAAAAAAAPADPTAAKVAAARAAAAERRMSRAERAKARAGRLKERAEVAMALAYEGLHSAPRRSVRGRLNALLDAAQRRVDPREDVFCALYAHYSASARGGGKGAAGGAAPAPAAPAMAMAMAPPPPEDAPIVMAPPPPAGDAPIVMAPPPPAGDAPIVMAPPPPADGAAIVMGEAPPAEGAAAAPAAPAAEEAPPAPEKTEAELFPVAPLTMYLPPAGAERAAVLGELGGLAGERWQVHRRMFVLSAALTPLTAALCVLPGPNVFFAWNAWRAYRHFAAWHGAARLADDLESGAAEGYLHTRPLPRLAEVVGDLGARGAESDADAPPAPLDFPPAERDPLERAQDAAEELLSPLGVRVVSLQRFLRRLRLSGRPAVVEPAAPSEA